jgi:hypothetical protein
MYRKVQESANDGPQNLLMGRANNASKPTNLEKDEVPKFSHRSAPSNIS